MMCRIIFASVQSRRWWENELHNFVHFMFRCGRHRRMEPPIIRAMKDSSFISEHSSGLRRSPIPCPYGRRRTPQEEVGDGVGGWLSLCLLTKKKTAPTIFHNTQEETCSRLDADSHKIEPDALHLCK